jgi:hypothetical protein
MIDLIDRNCIPVEERSPIFSQSVPRRSESIIIIIITIIISI